MQQFKIEHYKSEIPGNAFPEYSSLNEEERKEIISEIEIDVLSPHKDQNVFVRVKEVCLSRSVADSELNDLGRLLESLNFVCDNHIYIVWSVDEIDLMELNALTEHWVDIWYPPSDEAIILYCRSTQKIVLLTDWGQVFYN